MLLGQIGSVSSTPSRPRQRAALPGQPSVNLAIVKQPSANTVRVAGASGANLAEMQRSAPPDVRLRADLLQPVRHDPGGGRQCRRRPADAFVIVALVLVAFLGNLRSTAVSLLSIPISLVMTLIVFRLIRRHAQHADPRRHRHRRSASWSTIPWSASAGLCAAWAGPAARPERRWR
ncbi:MAG: efflux RND transporter permease subunit [Dongiaceae bacterium]